MTDDLRRDLHELPPSLDLPGDFFDRVMATARRRRRRARWGGSAGAAVVAAVAAVVLVVTTSGGPSTARLVPITPPATLPTSTPTSAPPASISPSPSPSPSASTAVTSPGLIPLSVSFVSAQLGWAFGPDQPPSGSQFPQSAPGALAVTHDGGQHWSMLPPPKVSYGGFGGAKSVLFVDPNRGYLYGDGLYGTTDGGLHWRRLAAPGSVSQLAATANALYLMAMSCPASAPLCGSYDLFSGRLDGTGFVRTGAVVGTADAQLSVVGSRVYVLWSPANSVAPQQYASLSTSADGQNWSTFATPCEVLGADYGAAAPFSDSGVALVCGNSASAGIQGKTAYVSTDFGASWSARGTSTSLPEGGYVGLLAATSESTWVLAEQRGGLLITHDGGSSWLTAGVSWPKSNQGTDGWAQLEFNDAEHAIAVPESFYSELLLVSADGGDNWTAVTFPP